MLMIDVDHFKKYNDTYGHLAGDAALMEIAAILRQSLKRPRDFVARYGGEEFAVILPHTNLDGASCIAETIRTSVFKAFNSGSQATISVGCAAARPMWGGNIEELINTADRMLYLAKTLGRNQVQIASEPVLQSGVTYS